MFLALALVTVGVYWRVCTFDFVNYDDPDYASENPHITAGLSLPGLAWAFTSIHSTNWHPLTTLTHMLDCQLWGINPLGPHLTNLILHLANTLLLFWLLFRMTGSRWRSLFVAAVFALHPMHVESVAWISERKDVLSGLFFMLTLLAYAKHVTTDRADIAEEKAERENGVTRRRGGAETQSGAEGNHEIRETNENKEGLGGLMTEDGGRKSPDHVSRFTFQPSGFTFHVSTFRLHVSRFYVLSLLCFTLGLMSKPMLVTLPFLLLLLDFWPFRRFERSTLNAQRSTLLRLLLEKIPFFLLTIGSAVVTFLVQRASGTVIPIQQISWNDRLANALVSYIRYLVKLFWPADLAVFYPYTHWGWVSWQVIGAGVLLAGLAAWAVWSAKRRPFILTGWFWYMGLLVPVIGLVQVGEQALADRYSYLSFIGIFILLAWGGQELLERLRAPTAASKTTALLVVAACVWATSLQLSVWRNTETLFLHAIKVTTCNHTAWSNLGLFYAQKNQHDRAADCYREAIRCRTNFPHAWNNLGIALVQQKKYEEGLVAFQTALSLAPDLAETHNNLGNALVFLDKKAEAIDHYAQAARLKPDYASARANLGGMLLRTGRLPEAIAELQASLRLKPANADVHADLARALAENNQPVEAIAEYQAAIQLRPDLAKARLALATLLLQQGNTEEAADQLGRVLQSEPQNAMAHYQLALVLSGQGRFQEGIEHYRAALAQQPDFPEALNNLAWIFAANADASLRNGAEAVKLAERACQLTSYKLPMLVGTLAAAYAEAGRFPDAIKTAQRAKAIAEDAKEMDLADRNAKLLELYRASKPYHEAAP